MRNPITAYTHWLHTQWPAGQVEKLPGVNDDGTTSIPGLYIVGDLTGVPLLKFSADSGARVVQRIADDRSFQRRQTSDEAYDLAIIGGGVSGFSAALEAAKRGLSYKLFEAAEPFSTIANFPKAKPIYTYPTDMTPSGQLQFHEKAGVKEGLLEDLHEQTLERGIAPIQARVEKVTRAGGVFEIHLPDQGNIKARRVIVGIGRSGNFRKLDVPGEDLDKVYNRLHDPADFCGQDVLVVGGGDSAMETAIALATCGADVTLSYRKSEFSRPKPDNVEKINALAGGGDVDDMDVETVEGDRVTTPSGGYQGEKRQSGKLTLMMASQVQAIGENQVDLQDADGNAQTLANDSVFAMIGREPPLDFFRRSGIRIRGEWNLRTVIGPALFLLVCLWVYSWKDFVPYLGDLPGWLSPDPGVLSGWLQSISDRAADPSTLLGTVVAGMGSPSFYYTLAYSLLVVIFGVKRIRRR
ncbi:MAG: NAD(P)-binding domain-containing protein, partial [Planctomycetes bacterium]|nr:NAD(P)-binding domain-containing protein [Planctomycetota bacterium]